MARGTNKKPFVKRQPCGSFGGAYLPHPEVGARRKSHPEVLTTKSVSSPRILDHAFSVETEGAIVRGEYLDSSHVMYPARRPMGARQLLHWAPPDRQRGTSCRIPKEVPGPTCIPKEVAGPTLRGTQYKDLASILETVARREKSMAKPCPARTSNARDIVPFSDSRA